MRLGPNSRRRAAASAPRQTCGVASQRRKRGVQWKLVDQHDPSVNVFIKYPGPRARDDA